MLHGIKVFPHLRQFFYPADNLGRVWENLRKKYVLIRDGQWPCGCEYPHQYICGYIRMSRAISDICRMMRISVSMRIGKYIRISIPSSYITLSLNRIWYKRPYNFILKTNSECSYLVLSLHTWAFHGRQEVMWVASKLAVGGTGRNTGGWNVGETKRHKYQRVCQDTKNATSVRCSLKGSITDGLKKWNFLIQPAIESQNLTFSNIFSMILDGWVGGWECQIFCLYYYY